MPKVTLVIPAYNEQSRLPASAVLAYLADHVNVTILFVNDGSSDQTGAIMEAAKQQSSGQIRTLHLERNSGKAEAVRQGMLHLINDTDADWLGFWDADLATPLSTVQTLLDHASVDTDLLMCSRIKRLGAAVERHAWRHVCGRIMATLVSFTLKLPVYDTQCGAKLIHRRIASELFSTPFLTKWLFDVEILARLIQHSGRGNVMRTVSEVPVAVWKDIKGSKLRFHDMLRTLIDIVRIKAHYRL